MTLEFSQFLVNSILFFAFQAVWRELQSQGAAQKVNRARALKGDRDANSAIIENDRPVAVSKTANSVHAGYLYKQSASVMKRWKHGYFVIEDKKSVSL